MSQINHNSAGEAQESNWAIFYKVSAIAALLIVFFIVVDMAMTSMPGGDAGSGTLSAHDWFVLLQDNALMGLRNLGLLNMINMLLMVPFYLALYVIHRKTVQPLATTALILFMIGASVYIANNKALPMLALSSDYAEAATEADQALLTAAGHAMLGEAEDFTPGAFMGFLIPSIAGIMMAVVMLRGDVFGRVAGWTGIVGLGGLLIFVIVATFIPSLFDAMMVVAMIGGLASIVWYVLTARRLFQLGRDYTR